MGGFINHLEKDPNIKIIVAGDLNCHLSKLEFLEQCGLVSVIPNDEPSHRAGNRLN